MKRDFSLGGINVRTEGKVELRKYEKGDPQANYSIKIPFITFPCENRIKQRTQIIIITNNANNNNNPTRSESKRGEERVENIKSSSAAKKYFTFKLAVILLEICFPLSLYIFAFVFFFFAFALTHSLSLYLFFTPLFRVCAALFIIQQGRRKNCIL
jgi:hypothetical protein